MKTFTIDAENNVIVHATRKAARESGAGVCTTEEQFADLIGPDAKRLVEIWNSIPGTTPVKKFKDRKTATERIWRAIQTFGESVQPETGEDAEAGSGDQAGTGQENALADETISQPAAEVERAAED